MKENKEKKEEKEENEEEGMERRRKTSTGQRVL